VPLHNVDVCDQSLQVWLILNDHVQIWNGLFFSKVNTQGTWSLHAVRTPTRPVLPNQRASMQGLHHCPHKWNPSRQHWLLPLWFTTPLYTITPCCMVACYIAWAQDLCNDGGPTPFPTSKPSSKLTSFSFYRALEYQTNNSGLNKPPVHWLLVISYYCFYSCQIQDRLSVFMLMVCQFQHVKMVKWAGKAYDPGSALKTAPGLLAIPCCACHIPNINLPAGWDNVPPEQGYPCSGGTLVTMRLQQVEIYHTNLS
jgi:hypothetical protein